MSPSRRARVLLVVTVYNGWAFVPRCLKSAKGLLSDLADIDVLALDDASPEPGFSARLKALCEEIGVRYYRTPRNLGIVRNVNLGLLAALDGAYDYVVVSNSDVIYSARTIDRLLEAAESDPKIGSVTAWSNNVSIYSLPNADPDQHLASQEVVNWLESSLSGNFRGEAIDIPAGISFAMLIPAQVIRAVGLMDPIFGRGYCEETDWALRSLSRGWRITLAPAAFVYHQGRGSTLGAGMLSGAHTTVPENEEVIDYRYPLFRDQVDAFIRGGILSRLHLDASRKIIQDAGRQFGYDVHFGSLLTLTPSQRVSVAWKVGPERDVNIEASFKGFRCSIPCAGESTYEALTAFFGPRPTTVDGFVPQPFQPREAGPLEVPRYPESL